MRQQEKLTTGTTTLGMVGKDCVILASESKSTLGGLVASKESQKVYQVDDKMAVTTAGSAGDAQAVVRIMKAEINIYKLTRKSDITIQAATTLLSNILSGNRYFPYITMLVIGGVDKSGGHIYSIDPFGGLEEDKFTATGSGSPIAYGLLEDMYHEGMSRDECIRLAVRAIRAARERDIFSGGIHINVAVIDKDGVQFVEKEKIKELEK